MEFSRGGLLYGYFECLSLILFRCVMFFVSMCARFLLCTLYLH
jgi:hypothetical protein